MATATTTEVDGNGEIPGLSYPAPEEQAALAVTLNEVLLQKSAEENMKVAQVRSEQVNIEVGTKNFVVQPGDKVTTFGNTKVVKRNGQDVIETSAPVAAPKPGYQVDVAAITAAEANNKNSFDVDAAIKNMRAITDPDQRDVAAQELFVNIGQQAAIVQERIRSQAAQRSGVNDAKAAFDKWVSLENAGRLTGKLKSGDHYYQTDEARKVWQGTLVTANQLEVDLLKQNPDIQKYTDYRTLLGKEMNQINRQQDKRDRLEDNFGALTPERLTNAKLAIGIAENDSAKLTPMVYNELKKNKALHAVLDASKSDYASLLAHPDATVRKYAYNIVAGKEATLNDGKIPDYIKALEPLIANRQALLSPETKKKLFTQSTAIGAKGKEEEQNTAIGISIASFIEQVGRNKYQDMNSWVFPVDGFKQVINDLKASTEGGRVLKSDGIDAIMKTEIKNPDGTVMNAQQKTAILVQSIGMTLENDKASAVLPSSELYGPLYKTETRNDAMRSYVRSQTQVPAFAIATNPGLPGSLILGTLLQSDAAANVVMGVQDLVQKVGETADAYGARLVKHGKKLMGSK